VPRIGSAVPVQSRTGLPTGRFRAVGWPDHHVVAEFDGRTKYRTEEDVFLEQLRQDELGAPNRSAWVRMSLSEDHVARKNLHPSDSSSSPRGVSPAPVSPLRCLLRAATPWAVSPGESVLRWMTLVVGLPRAIAQFPVLDRVAGRGRRGTVHSDRGGLGVRRIDGGRYARRRVPESGQCRCGQTRVAGDGEVDVRLTCPHRQAMNQGGRCVRQTGGGGEELLRGNRTR